MKDMNLSWGLFKSYLLLNAISRSQLLGPEKYWLCKQTQHRPCSLHKKTEYVRKNLFIYKAIMCQGDTGERNMVFWSLFSPSLVITSLQHIGQRILSFVLTESLKTILNTFLLKIIHPPLHPPLENARKSLLDIISAWSYSVYNQSFWWMRHVTFATNWTVRSLWTASATTGVQWAEQ